MKRIASIRIICLLTIISATVAGFAATPTNSKKAKNNYGLTKQQQEAADEILKILIANEMGNQNTSADSVCSTTPEEIFVAVEQPAEFHGGIPALMEWLSEHISYPESAEKDDTEGRVVVKFVIEKDGSVGQAEVIRSVRADLDNEALRVVKAMPKWNPGKNDGIPVRSYFTLPVNFKIPREEGSDKTTIPAAKIPMI